MKLIRTEEAVGHVLCHDMTQIIKDQYKDARFRKGHIVTEDDIPVLLSMGKENLYVWEMTPGMVHENDAAERLLALCGQENMVRSETKEGKIELRAACDGLFRVDSRRLIAVNSLEDIMIATRKGNTAVKKGDKLAGMRVIPLIIEEEKLQAAEQAAGTGPLLELLRIHDFKVDRLYFFISHLYRHIVPTLVKDMNNVCPETEIVPVITNLNGVLTYEDIAPAYKVFSAYFEQYRFDLSNERYFFHLGPGNLFQHALMLIMLFHFKRLPFQMLRLAPNPEKPGDIIMEIYEGDIRKWIASIADSEKRNVAAQTFLKSCIETRNPVFNKLIEEMEHVATHSTAPVLLSGPTGSGKSHLARKIYELRYNKGLVPGSFVEVNCATLQGESVLSNLFGHVRGSFTGATTVRQGLLKTAHEGILFLDEIAEIPLQIQVILLKAIEEKKFYPFGSDTPVHSDFQLICGTNRDLAEEVRQGRFRLDLLSRINMWHFRLPALRERLEDIEPNINYELDRHTRLKGFKADFLPEARERYLNFAMSPEAIWPGNFRDLSSSIERMQSYALGGIINEELVEEEIIRLRAIWHTPALAELPAPKQGVPLLSRLFTPSQLDQMDLFDKIQLENVIRVCCDCSTRTEAGRKLFGVSRGRKKHADDTTRLNKYLKSQGVTWEQIQSLRYR